MSSPKHAYLIIAHNEFGILEKLIKLLDDRRNDIYVHIDKKVSDFDFGYFKNLTTKSQIFFVNRLDVRWGDFSMIQCEIRLLEAAVSEGYQYYHLLSGVDLPLKSNDEIHDFFDKHQGKEFIHFTSLQEAKNVEFRVLNYHFMRTPEKLCKFVNYFFRLLHKVTRYKRKWDASIPIRFGANWFSITNELAKYVVSMEQWVEKYFHHTACGDEIFLQTIVYSSKFHWNLYHQDMDGDYLACMRYIDWKRGNPYIFREEDFDFLINSDRLFARKFSSAIDEKIIERIYEYILEMK